MFRVIQPVTHHKGVRDGKACVVDLHRLGAALGLVQQSTQPDGGGLALSQQLQQVSQVSDQLASGSGNIAEAVSALVVLGYSQSEAARAIAGQPAETSVQDLIKTGLKKLAGSR